MIRLVMADDHTIVRSGLRQIFALGNGMEVVAEATSGAELLEILHRTACDVLLMDLNMPGLSGFDLIHRIRLHWPSLPLLVLSMHNEPMVAARALKAGASGYITKDCEPAELLGAVRKVAAAGKYIAPELAEQMVFCSASTEPASPHSVLSDRELEVMQLLVDGKGVNEIATRLFISSKTVSTHKVRLMEKLGLGNMADLVRYALQHNM